MSSKKNSSPLRQLTLNFNSSRQKEEQSPPPPARPTIQCAECGMVYTPSNKEHEQMHEKHHRSIKSEKEKVLNYTPSQSKQETVVRTYLDGKCVVVSAETAPKTLVTRAMQALAYVDRDLGIHDELERAPFMAKFYMFVSANSNRIDGLCLAEPVDEAYWAEIREGGLLTYDDTKPERLSGLCGISRIWVSEHMRRRRIATRLLDCVCTDFLYVVKIEPRRLAFSDPTQFGQALANSYIKSNTFLVYKHRNKRV